VTISWVSDSEGLSLFSNVFYLLTRQTRQYPLRDFEHINLNQRILSHMAFLDRPVAECSDSPIVGMLTISAFTTSKKTITPLAGEWIIMQEWLQTYAVEAYRLGRFSLSPGLDKQVKQKIGAG
jgi:hypothetical protein